MKNSLFLGLFIFIGQQIILAQNTIPYQLDQVKQRIVLPDELREVSGLTVIDSKTLACVQDEAGIAFIYDLDKQEIKRKIHFAGPGDYEGIAPVGKDLYVLRSDGVLFLIRDFAKNNPAIDSIETGIPNKDNEGLCFDKENKRLLIGSKSKIGKGPAYKNLRTIYAFDHRRKQLVKTPLYTYDNQRICRNKSNSASYKRKQEKSRRKGSYFEISAFSYLHSPEKSPVVCLERIRLLSVCFQPGGTDSAFGSFRPKKIQ